MQLQGSVSSTVRRRQIFVVTWITYAGFYLCRKNLSVVLPLLHETARSGRLELANIVFGYSLLYAIGQFGCGFLSDRFGARRVVGAGLLLVVASNLLMGTQASLSWLLLLACLNGVGQSTGWSGLVKIMAIWFKGKNRGIVMAWWGTNYVFGGFLATMFATWAIAQHRFFPRLGWQRGFLFPALLLLLITLMFFAGVRDEAESEGELQYESLSGQSNRSTWCDLALLLRRPSLWMISISYFFLELCRYALMFWLPLYMVDRLRYSLQISGYLSSLYELAGILGAVLAGYISDRLWQSRRAPVSAVMLCAMGCIMLLQPTLSHYGTVGTAVAISLAGALTYGPDTLLSGAGAQDIGEARAAATASGLVDGIGHLGALFSPYVVIYISGHFGWDRLFLVFAGSAFLASAVLIPIWNLRPVDQQQLPVPSEAIQQTT